jgi:pyrimidine operon attenuation protein/uracil phosphoribosyltransferase
MDVNTSFFRSHTSQVFRAQGAVEMVLVVLNERGIEVSDEVRERIEACEDLELAKLWLNRALTVVRAEDVFEDTID